MGVAWSSISFAGCAYCLTPTLPSLPHPPYLRRICLERLGVVEESDHKALIIKVFWRHVSRNNESLGRLDLMISTPGIFK